MIYRDNLIGIFGFAVVLAIFCMAHSVLALLVGRVYLVPIAGHGPWLFQALKLQPIFGLPVPLLLAAYLCRPSKHPRAAIAWIVASYSVLFATIAKYMIG